MNRLLEYLNIDSEIEDFEKIHQNIEKDLIFKGTNLWILVFAIVVASVGLNINSTAVIIGAMLISPLMGPINGLGYSIATYNFQLFRKAFKNFGFAVGAGLLASTAYFAMSPVSTAHSELLARTSPTIYDVIIALFGGLAGIVAISSRQKGNVIPGVAIATALMPPLCTAGYGLATAQFNFFFGALYLFTINTVFIGISATVVSQLLKFPITTIVEPKHKKSVNRWITVVIIITIIPSIYFGYQMVEKERFLESAKQFTRNLDVLEGSYLLRQEINPERKIVTLTFGGNLLTAEQKKYITDKANQHLIDSSSLKILQGFSINNIDANNETEELKNEINRLKIHLIKQQDSLQANKNLGQQLYNELNAIYPEIASTTYSTGYIFSDPKNNPPLISMVYIVTTDTGLTKEEKKTIELWLRKRLNTNAIRVNFDQ